MTTRRLIVLGEGQALTATTMIAGMPGIVVCEAPAATTGDFKEPAPEQAAHMQENGVYIMFANPAGALRFIQRIQESCDTFLKSIEENTIVQSQTEDDGA